ncbi:MAG: GAF domain-containing protein [Betaproteobacteria bacterium]
MNARDLSSCLDVIEAELRTLSGVDCYAINLHQPAENAVVCARLHLPSEYANIEGAFSQYSMPLESGDASTVAIQTGKTVVITSSNLGEFSERTQAGFLHGKMNCLAVLPIRSNGADQPCTGTIVLISLQKTIPTAMLEKVGKFMAEAAPILQLHQRAASLEARNYSIRLAEKELQSLLHFISEMTNLTTEEDLYPRIEQEFLNRFELDFAAILIADHGVLHCADTRFVPEDVPWCKSWRAHCEKISYLIERRDAASSNALINNRPFYFGNIPGLRDLPMGALDKANLDILNDLQTFAIQPIRNCGKPVGILWLGSMHTQNALSSEQLRLIQQLCDFLGGIIENARRYGALCVPKDGESPPPRKVGKAARQA